LGEEGFLEGNVFDCGNVDFDSEDFFGGFVFDEPVPFEIFGLREFHADLGVAKFGVRLGGVVGPFPE
jgi:hypothetical protein